MGVNKKIKHPVIVSIVSMCIIAVGYIIKYLLAPSASPLSAFFIFINRNYDIVWYYFLFIVLFYSAMKIILSFVEIKSKNMPEKQKTNEKNTSQTELIAGMISQIGESAFSKIRLARYLSELILEILAYRNHKTPGNMLNQLRQGTLPVPENLREYMKASLIFVPADITEKKRFFFRRKVKGNTVLDLDPEIVIKYIETQYLAGNGGKGKLTI